MVAEEVTEGLLRLGVVHERTVQSPLLSLKRASRLEPKKEAPERLSRLRGRVIVSLSGEGIRTLDVQLGKLAFYH